MCNSRSRTTTSNTPCDDVKSRALVLEIAPRTIGRCCVRGTSASCGASMRSFQLWPALERKTEPAASSRAGRINCVATSGGEENKEDDSMNFDDIQEGIHGGL